MISVTFTEEFLYWGSAVKIHAVEINYIDDNIMIFFVP